MGDHIILSQLDYWPWNKNKMNKNCLILYLETNLLLLLLLTLFLIITFERLSFFFVLVVNHEQVTNLNFLLFHQTFHKSSIKSTISNGNSMLMHQVLKEDKNHKMNMKTT
jgi:hypothetical protein